MELKTFCYFRYVDIHLLVYGNLIKDLFLILESWRKFYEKPVFRDRLKAC